MLCCDFDLRLFHAARTHQLSIMVCAGDHAALDGLVKEASNAFYDLAYCSCRRIAQLCSEPEYLAAWALELLLRQASEAVIFVRDLDQSVLGARNSIDIALACFKMLR